MSLVLKDTAQHLCDIDRQGRSLCYLAAPYSHDRPAVMEERYKAISAVTAALMREGVPVFSPITYSHVLATDHGLPETWGFWADVDRTYLSCSYVLVVLMLEGWEESTGVTAERRWADYQIPIRFLQPQPLELSDDPTRLDTAPPRDVRAVPGRDGTEKRGLRG